MNVKDTFPNVLEFIRKAREGDVKARAILQLDPGVKSKPTITQSRLKRDLLEKEKMKQEIVKTTYMVEAAARLGMASALDQQQQQQGLFLELYYQLHKERLRVDFHLDNDRLLYCMKILLEENVDDLVEIISKETHKDDGQSLSEDESEDESEEAYDPAKDSDPGDSSEEEKRPSSSKSLPPSKTRPKSPPGPPGPSNPIKPLQTPAALARSP